MEYDFDKLTSRRGTKCCKWDAIPGKDMGGNGPWMDDMIPLWVADMDFEAAPFIQSAIKRRVEHGIYGYTDVPADYRKAVCAWFGRRYGWEFGPEQIVCTTGVIPAMSATIMAFTQPGDKVIVQTPVYNHFFSSIRNNGCEALPAPLRYVEEDGQMTYRMDFEALEAACSDPKAKIFLLCNPHNPAGKVWTADELRKAGEICIRHGVIPVSDEIHCELVMPGYKYSPFATVSEELRMSSITFCSPSKNFNIAGLQAANIITANEQYRAKVDKAININETCDLNPFGIEGVMSAYGVPGNEDYPTGPGEEWLDQLNEYLWENYKLLQETFKKKAPHCPVIKLEGTYLAWVDIRATGKSSVEVCREMLTGNGVWLNPGKVYGDDNFIRINLATQRTRFTEALNRIAAYFDGAATV